MIVDHEFDHKRFTKCKSVLISPRPRFSDSLAQITGAVDFPLLLIQVPLQLVFCMIFLYSILGWRYVYERCGRPLLMTYF